MPKYATFAATRPHTMSATEPVRFAELRALVVEPLAPIAADLAAQLADLGCRDVAVASTRAEALDLAAQRKPNMVFCNVRLESFDDGLDAAIGICEGLDAAVVFLSTHHDKADVQRALQDSPFGYVSHPFDARLLAKAVDDALLNTAKGAGSFPELRRLAATAPTGIGTPRRMENALHREWNRCALDQTPLSLILLEAGNFENQSPQTDYGREGLAAIAGALKICCSRRRDVIAHYGPNRFAILLPATDETGACKVAERVVETLRDLQLRESAAPGARKITASAGLSTMVPSEDKDISALIERAGRRLETAKQAGGDRVQPKPPPASPAKHGFLERWKSLLGGPEEPTKDGRRRFD